MFIYEFCCSSCKKVFEIERHHSQSGEPYACPNCGIETQRIYSATSPKEFAEFYTKDGKRIGTHKQDKANLRKHGRVLTQDTNGWSDIKKMAREGQRRTLLNQKGHY